MLFRPGRLSLGLVLPLRSTQQRDIDYSRQIAFAQRADRLGFSALWVRDVPLNSADYPDPVGHADPWVLLGALAASTRQIALVTGAIVLPLRHPLHIAKAALSVSDLSNGRFVLGLGSGDRPSEFAAFGRDHAARKELFRDNWLRLASALDPAGGVLGADGAAKPSFELLPRRIEAQIPLIAVGSAGQSLEWIARHAAGWATYHREFAVQRDRIMLWQSAVAKVTHGAFRSFSQAMVLDLLDDPHAPRQTVELGYRLGRHALIEVLAELSDIGVHHIMFNIAHSIRPIEDILDELAAEVMPALDRSIEPAS